MRRIVVLSGNYYQSQKGGEYEMLVLDAPFFETRIELVETEKVWMGDHGVLRVVRAELADK